MNYNYNYNYIDITGYIAGSLIVVGFLPQLFHIIKNKSAKDISIPTFLINLLGNFTWIFYGYLISNLAVIISNIILSIIISLILLFSFIYKN